MATQVSLNSGAVASAGALDIQTNGTTQAVSISTGQVATLAQNPILTSGTANGVAYLNGSKVLTTGSALVFDGTNFGVGVTPVATWSGYKVLQAGIASFAGGSSGAYLLQDNCYTDNSGGTWKYINSSYAPAQYYAASGAHVWRTAASGTAGNAISFTQAMTLDASGNLLVGTTSAAAKLTVVANNASANGSAYIQNDTGTSGSGVLYTNFSNASATTSSYYFLVARNGGGSTYVLRADGTMTFSSDARLKKNIVSSDGYLSRLNQLRPVSYQWNYQKEDDETTSLGLIAQEVEQVFPNLVLEESFVEGEEARKSVKYSELPMMLLKAIQEQQALITQLQADVAALKGA